MEKLKNNIKKYKTDVVYKTEITLYLSFSANLLYAGLNGFLVFVNRSFWFALLAGYYVILSVMRFLLIKYIRKNPMGEHYRDELIRSRICAVILTLVDITLPCVVLMMIYRNKGYEYKGVLIYAMAVYTFYATVHSLINVIKCRKMQSPVILMAMLINLSAAFVSMLSLQTAMLTRFGGERTVDYKNTMIALTGTGVSLAVFFMAVWMIVFTTKELKRGQSQNNK